MLARYVAWLCGAQGSNAVGGEFPKPGTGLGTLMPTMDLVLDSTCMTIAGTTPLPAAPRGRCSPKCGSWRSPSATSEAAMSDWRPIGIHDIASGIDWSDTSRLTDCDPYLIWADLNATKSSRSGSRISLLVEVSASFDWDHEVTLGVTQVPWLANPPTIVPCVVEDLGGLVDVVHRLGRDVLA